MSNVSEGLKGKLYLAPCLAFQKSYTFQLMAVTKVMAISVSHHEEKQGTYL